MEGEDDPRAQKLLAKLGLEPLEDAFTADVFTKAPAAPSRYQTSAIEWAYCCWSWQYLCFRGAISPKYTRKPRPDNLTKAQAKRLWQAVRDVMHNAIEMGGSSLRNYSNAQR